jgi:hypothetical protein
LVSNIVQPLHVDFMNQQIVIDIKSRFLAEIVPSKYLSFLLIQVGFRINNVKHAFTNETIYAPMTSFEKNDPFLWFIQWLQDGRVNYQLDGDCSTETLLSTSVV